MPKSGMMLSERENNMIIKKLDALGKAVEKLKGRFQGSGEGKGKVPTNKSRRARSGGKSAPAA